MSLTLFVFIFLFCLALSAFFSGTETALTALPVSRVDTLCREGGMFERRAWRRWRQRPHRVLVTLLIGNTTVNVGISALVTKFTIDTLGDHALGLMIGITTLVVLVFGEVTPKTLARVDPQNLGRRTIALIGALDWVLTPITVPLLGLSHMISHIWRVPLSQAPTASRPEDLRFLISLSRQEGHLSELQAGMLDAVLHFELARLRDVQIPRTDMVFLSDQLNLGEVHAKVLTHGYSRYPVFHDRDDNVIGILLVKDLLRPMAENTPWTSLLQPALFVPESKLVVDLLREMRARRTHIALSVDEHGNIAGVVTMEDLIELIVGDIDDEFDTAEPLWHRESESSWLVRGSFSLDRLARLVGKHLPTVTDYTSVAGLLLAEAGRVPEPGATFTIGELRFEVVDSSPRRIERVRVSVVVVEGSPPRSPVPHPTTPPEHY